MAPSPSQAAFLDLHRGQPAQHMPLLTRSAVTPSMRRQVQKVNRKGWD